MNMKDSRNWFNVVTKFVQGFFNVAVVLLLLYFIIGEIVMPDERDVLRTECRLLELQWYQIQEDGEKTAVEIPEKLPAEYGEIVTLTAILPDDLYNGEMICYRAIWQDVEIYVDGELRQSYHTENSRVFGKNSAMRNIFAELKESDAGKELVYKISSNSKYAGNIFESYIGDRTSIWLHLIKKTGSKTVVSIFLFLMSLFCIIVCIILKIVYKKKLSLENLAWTVFFCALWMLSESEFRQLLFKNVSVLSGYTYWSLMLIPIPVLLYMNEVQEGRYKKCYTVCFAYSIVMFTIGTTLQVLDKVEFVQQLPLIQLGFAAAVLMTIGTITRDVIKKQISNYVVIGVGVYGMLLTAIIELGLYYIDMGLSLGTILGLGFIFLLIMAIIKTGQDLIAFEKNRQQAILAKEAQAKFLANMSHEIRTPINVVIGMNEMILRESEKDIITEYANNIQSASNMLLGLINDILDFSKIESGQLELVEDTYAFSDVLYDEILLLNVRAAGKELDTHIEIEPKLPSKFYGDELRIKQVLTNLLSNAVKYTKEGSVTLRVSFSWIDNDTAKVIFSVTDTGMGIRQEDIPNLFDSFKRLELNETKKIEGTGLGLNIVKQLVEMMQGEVSVESTFGKGSTFTVSVPQKVVDKQPVGDLQTLLKERRKDVKTSSKIFTAPDAVMLVVDDNALNLVVMKELLKRTKIQVDFASSGKECLEMTQEKLYDIILLDHMMPEMDGIETLHMLRKDILNKNQNTIVIALTANAVAGSREMYLGYGFNDYFAKPIQSDKLESMLMQYLPRALVHMEDAIEEIVVEEEHVEEQSIFSQQDMSEDKLYIDEQKGLANCLGQEDFYRDMLLEFCKQCDEYLPQLRAAVENSDWANYGLACQMLKEDALNIGADNFSKLAQRHAYAGEHAEVDYIEAKYAGFVETIEKLVEKITN